MSDGISDAYRYEQDERSRHQYLMALATHLIVGTQDTLENLTSSSVVKPARLQETIKGLKEGNLQEWAKFLIDCQENNSYAYKRIRAIAPWPGNRSIKLVKFDNWSELGKFFNPFFSKLGYATDEGNGNISGYDMYVIIYSEEMSIEQIVKESVWVGFKTTGWPAFSHADQEPTSPWKKDRKKSQ